MQYGSTLQTSFQLSLELWPPFRESGTRESPRLLSARLSYSSVVVWALPFSAVDSILNLMRSPQNAGGEFTPNCRQCHGHSCLLLLWS